MSVVSTSLRIRPLYPARSIGVQPVSGITATDVQSALVQVEGQIQSGSVTPPAFAPTSIVFAQSPYTVQPSDYLLQVDTSGGAITINMMAASARGNKEIEIKDSSGNASTNNISIVRNGADTLDGLTTYPISGDFGAVKFKPKTSGGYAVV